MTPSLANSLTVLLGVDVSSNPAEHKMPFCRVTLLFSLIILGHDEVQRNKFKLRLSSRAIHCLIKVAVILPSVRDNTAFKCETTQQLYYNVRNAIQNILIDICDNI